VKAAKAIVPRSLASRDVEQAIDHYLVEANERGAFGFVDALEKAYHYIAHHPMSGSPRYAHQLGLRT
jgi:toxin ParE1/3/4